MANPKTRTVKVTYVTKLHGNITKIYRNVTDEQIEKYRELYSNLAQADSSTVEDYIEPAK